MVFIIFSESRNTSLIPPKKNVLVRFSIAVIRYCAHNQVREERIYFTFTFTWQVSTEKCRGRSLVLEMCVLFHTFHSCCFLIKVRITNPGKAPHAMVWAFQYQSLIKKKTLQDWVTSNWVVVHGYLVDKLAASSHLLNPPAQFIEPEEVKLILIPTDTSFLHVSVFGRGNFPTYWQKRNINSSATNPLIYSGVLLERCARTMGAQIL